MKPEIIQKRKQIQLLRKFASSKDEERAVVLVEFAESLGDTDLERALNPFNVVHVQRLEKSGRISDFSIKRKELVDSSRRISPYLYNILWRVYCSSRDYKIPISDRIKNIGVKIGLTWIESIIVPFERRYDKQLGEWAASVDENDIETSGFFPMVFVESKDLKPHLLMENNVIRGWAVNEAVSKDFRVLEHPSMADILRACFHGLIDIKNRNCFYGLCFEKMVPRSIFTDCIREANEYLFKSSLRKKPAAHQDSEGANTSHGTKESDIPVKDLKNYSINHSIGQLMDTFDVAETTLRRFIKSEENKKYGFIKKVKRGKFVYKSIQKERIKSLFGK